MRDRWIVLRAMNDAPETENPFASPELVETRDGDLLVYARPRSRMPWAVMWVIGYSIVALAAWLWVAIDVFRAPTEFDVRIGIDDYIRAGFGVVAFLIAIIGSIARNLLVYRFARGVVTVLGAMLIVSSGAVAWQIANGNEELDLVTWVYLAITAATLFTFVMLNRKSTKAYFGLQCPECGKSDSVRANFLQTRVRCSACRVSW
jgi:hypothetical protein